MCSQSMEATPGPSPLSCRCTRTALLCMRTKSLIDCFILISHGSSLCSVERCVCASLQCKYCDVCGGMADVSSAVTVIL